MTGVLRALALLIAMAGILDPALAIRRLAPVPVEIRLPAAGDPDFAEATNVRRELLSRLDATVATNAPDSARAVITIGNTDVDVPEGPAVFAISLPQRSPSVRVVSASADVGAVGQQMSVVAKLAPKGMRGRKTLLSLSSGSAALARIEHSWTNDEIVETRIPYSPPKPGLSIVRLSVSGGGVAALDVDVPMFVAVRRFRVLIYEPRPTWAASFVRQAVEAHEIFQTVGAARTSRGTATVTSGGWPSLTTAHLDESDTVVVSGLDALSASDETQLHRFVTVRGGALILVPDAMLPERLRHLFQLPPLQEALLERPASIAAGPTNFLASELLLLPSGEPNVRALARVGHGAADRTAIFATYRGRGQVVVSGALDAWRFRGSPGSAFATVWQGLIADAAASAMPRVSVEVEPPLARPGEAVTLRVRVRETEWTTSDGGVRVPALSASLISASRGSTSLRLWPGTAAAEFIARFPAPEQGAYDVRVAADGRMHDAPLAVRDDALTLPPDRGAALALLARSSGGAAIPATDLDKAVAVLRALVGPAENRRVRPMQSAWWILPFSMLLGLEWTLRRQKGRP